MTGAQGQPTSVKEGQSNKNAVDYSAVDASGRPLFTAMRTPIIYGKSYLNKTTGPISKEKVMVGEPFFLKYRIQLEDNDKIIISKLSKLFPAERIASNSKMEGEKFMQIEILNSFDTLYLEKDGKHYWACEFQLVAWDTGLVVLNGLNYSINNSNSNFSSVFIESMLMKAEKGKVIEDIEKGYYLNDKVIRFSKVVVGQ